MPSEPFDLDALAAQMSPNPQRNDSPSDDPQSNLHPLDLAFELTKQAFGAYASGDHQTTSILLVRSLALLNETPILGVDETERIAMGQILTSILNLFCRPDYMVPEELGFQFLGFNALIGNIMEGCLLTTTDPYLIQVQNQKQSVYKTLVLYTARNETSVDIANILVANPDLVSRWLYQTWKVVFSGNCSEKVTANLQRFLSQMDHRILPAMDMQELYFGCTYLGIPEERRAKELVNQSIQRNISVSVRCNPDPRKVAVFSEYWSNGHSVHRTLGQYIEALKPHFHITFLHSLREADHLDTALFDEVIRIPFNDGSLDLSPIMNNEFSALIFPDVGMTLPSILMVNMRIAPAQMIMTGHPVSTFGAHTDYFISGSEVDVPMIAKQNYTERLVLLPGYGAVHEIPSYAIQGKKKSTTDVLINCSWYGQKIHWHCLDTVNAAMKRCKNRVKLRIFSGFAPVNHKGYPAFLNEISRRMTNCWVEIVPHISYPEYMGLMEEGDFAIDVFPFAGSNTVADNLHLRKPTLVREGFRWFNRIGTAMLRSANLHELIATSDHEYVEKLVRLVDDVDYRNNCRDILAKVDLENTVFSPKGAKEFAQFVQNIANNPNHYPGFDPITL